MLVKRDGDKFKNKTKILYNYSKYEVFFYTLYFKSILNTYEKYYLNKYEKYYLNTPTKSVFDKNILNAFKNAFEWTFECIFK